MTEVGDARREARGRKTRPVATAPRPDADIKKYRGAYTQGTQTRTPRRPWIATAFRAIRKSFRPAPATPRIPVSVTLGAD